MDFLQWVPLLTALGIGGLIANWVGGGKERRELRAAVLERLAEVEQARWVGRDSGDWHTFQTTCRSIETAALIARVSRKAVGHYLRFATAAWSLSSHNWDTHGDDEGGGSISPEMNLAVAQAAEVLIILTWKPWRRFTLRRSLEKRETTLVDKLPEDERRWVTEQRRPSI